MSKDEKLQKLKDVLADQLGLSDEWKDGTYLYHLTRVKSAFNVGTMTLADFVEVDDEFLEEVFESVKPIYEEQQKQIQQWKELFFLLKSDWEKEENWQTKQWMVKARSIGIDV